MPRGKPWKENQKQPAARGRPWEAYGEPVIQTTIESEAPQGYFGQAKEALRGIGEDIKGREKKIQESRRALAAGERTRIGSGYYLGGQTALAGLDVLGGVASAIAPEWIEGPVKKGVLAATKTIGKLPVYGGGTLATEIPKELEKHPRLAEFIEATVGYGGVLSPVKGKPKAKIGAAGERLAKAGEKQIATKKQRFLEDLVRPKETPTVKAEMAGRTEVKGRLFKEKIVKPSRQEIEMIKEVGKVKGIKSSNLIQENLNILQKESLKEGRLLKRKLEKSNITFTKKEFDAAIKKTMEDIGRDPNLVGDVKKIADNLLSEFEKILKTTKMTPSGLLQARKDFDSFIKEFRPKLLDPKTESAYTSVIRGIRQGTNNFIAEKVPDAAVRQSLNKQHRLLSTVENLKPKAALQANKPLERMWKKVERAVSLKGIAASAVAVGGGAAVGASVIPIAVSAGGLYLGGKLLTGAQTKIVLGKILKASSKAIKEEKTASVLKQLRADRAIILELSKSMGGSE